MQSSPCNVSSGATLSEEQTKALMSRHDFSAGLASSMIENKEAFPSRTWIVDNSGSMGETDGHRRFTDGKSVWFQECTRWDELKDCVKYHIEMAQLLQAPTVFRLLKNPDDSTDTYQFSVATTDGVPSTPEDVATAKVILDQVPLRRGTPLTRHIQEIRQEVASLAPQLTANGQRHVIVIATDGVPTDENGYCHGDREQKEFIQALRTLEGLPVWVVIRLCTDDDKVVNFYNDLDEQLELSLEVLDDFVAEAKEVHEFNPWLNYTLPLHRCREMGFYDRVLDLMDERQLSKTELCDYCGILFGRDQMDGVPDPELQWDKFVTQVERLNGAEKSQHDPNRKTFGPLVNIKQLKKSYGPKRGISFRIFKR